MTFWHNHEESFANHSKLTMINRVNCPGEGENCPVVSQGKFNAWGNVSFMHCPRVLRHSLSYKPLLLLHFTVKHSADIRSRPIPRVYMRYSCAVAPTVPIDQPKSTLVLQALVDNVRPPQSSSLTHSSVKYQ